MTRLAAASDERVGSYTPVVLTRVLKRAAEEGRTGALSVVSGSAVKTVHFVKGSVKFAASNVRRDRLGESMLAHEFISETDYDLASRKMTNDGCRFGEALLSLGVLTEEELQRELAIQVQRIVLSLFRMPEGMYSFEEGGKLPSSLPFGLSVASLLLKGLRMVEDGKTILSALPSADAVLRASPSTGLKIDVKKLSAAERTVLELAGDGMMVGDIIRKCELGRSAAFRSCFALLALGLLEPVPGETAQDEVPEATAFEAPSIELSTALVDEVDEGLVRLVEEQFGRLDELSDADLLGVRTGAAIAEIENAYEGLKQEWSELREQTRDPELVEKIGAIELRLAAAFAQLLVDAEAPPADSAPAPEDFARRERLRQLERDAELHLQVRDWKGAVSLLHELIALAPEVAKYQAMLGQAMYHQSSMRKHAEQHFLEAVRLAPNDPKYRVCLGRYYQSLGNASRAHAELRSALDLEPANEEALALLGRLQKPTRMRKLFQRVFG